MKRLISLLMMICLLGGTFAAAEERLSIDDEFDELFKRYNTTGAVLTIAKDGEIVYQYNYGLAVKKSRSVDEEPVTDDTYFRIASVTKMITAIHVMQLVERGLLNLDTDISEYFGYTIRNPQYKKTPITLRQLMSHTSSINAGGGYANNMDGSVWYMLSLERNSKSNYHKFKPGSKYVYSNFGAGLMGSLIEIATDKNLNTSVTDDLFAPLGIQAAYNVNLLDDPEKTANIYNAKGALVNSRSNYLRQDWDGSVNPEHHFRSTAGALWIRGEDLCRLGMLLCQGGTLNGVTILEPKTVASMLESQLDKPGVSCDSKYGLCVYRDSGLLKERVVYGHQGMSEGLVAGLFFDPESQFVYSMVTNGSSSKMNYHMAFINRGLFAKAWELFGEPGVE